MSSLFGKSKVAALVAEVFGTAVLALTVLTVVNSLNTPIFTSTIAGLTAGVMVLVIGMASGAHLNPAVTLGLWCIRKVQTTQAVVYIAAQLLGGLAAWRLSEYLLNTESVHIAEWGLDKRVLVAEAIGAFIFTFGVAAAVYSLYEGRRLAATIGGSLALGILVASLGSGGIINPAVAVALNSVSWAYALGPILGGVLGMVSYSLLFAPESVKGTAEVSVKSAKSTKPAKTTRTTKKKPTRK